MRWICCIPTLFSIRAYFLRYAGASGQQKISPFIKMRGLLHEKIQLYIYKPSINRCCRGATAALGVTNQLISGVKIPCPYYGEFTE